MLDVFLIGLVLVLIDKSIDVLIRRLMKKH